jgi:hypothetical protein
MKILLFILRLAKHLFGHIWILYYESADHKHYFRECICGKLQKMSLDNNSSDRWLPANRRNKDVIGYLEKGG